MGRRKLESWLSPNPFSPMTLADKFESLLIDLDGVVYLGDSPLEGAPETIRTLRERGKKVVFITNDPRNSPEGYAEKLLSMGVEAKPSEIVTSVMAVCYYLRKQSDFRGESAFVVGTESMKKEFLKMGMSLKEGEEAQNARFVIVGGHDGFNYEEMKRAALAVRRGAEFLATNRDAVYPTPEGLVPGTGAVLASIELASGRRARSVGKPGAIMFEAALDTLEDPGKAAVVGDRLDSDIKGGKNANLPTILTLSGATTPKDLRDSKIKPDYVIESLRELLSAPIEERIYPRSP